MIHFAQCLVYLQNSVKNNKKRTFLILVHPYPSGLSRNKCDEVGCRQALIAQVSSDTAGHVMNSKALEVAAEVREKTSRTEPAAGFKVIPHRADRFRSALDPTVARLAVELSLPENIANANKLESLLDSLRELVSLDCVFAAILDEPRTRIEVVHGVVGAKMKNCKPQNLIGSMQPCSPDMLKRFSKHQLLDVRDYNSQGPDYELFSSYISSINLSSALVGGIRVQDQLQGLMFFGTLLRRSSWDVEMHLIMKLMSASFAAGLERHQLRRPV